MINEWAHDEQVLTQKFEGKEPKGDWKFVLDEWWAKVCGDSVSGPWMMGKMSDSKIKKGKKALVK